MGIISIAQYLFAVCTYPLLKNNIKKVVLQMEKWIIYLTDDDGHTLCAKPFVGTTEEADYECEFLMDTTGCDVSFMRYTEQRWNRLKKYYQPQQNMTECIEKEWKKCQ